MSMSLKDTPLAIALVVLVASVAYPQAPQTNRIPVSQLESLSLTTRRPLRAVPSIYSARG
jgi:hypothetical protein